MKTTSGLPTFEGDADRVASDLPEWAGLEQLWDDNRLDEDFHFFLHVVQDCRDPDIGDRIDGDDRPMMTEVVYTIKIVDEDEAKAKMAEGVRQRLAGRRGR